MCMFVYRKEIVIIFLLSVLNILRLGFNSISILCVLCFICLVLIYTAHRIPGASTIYVATQHQHQPRSLSRPHHPFSSPFWLSRFPRILSSSSVTNFCIFCHKFVRHSPQLSHCPILLSCFRPCWLFSGYIFQLLNGWTIFKCFSIVFTVSKVNLEMFRQAV